MTMTTRPDATTLARWNATAAEKLEGWRWFKCNPHSLQSTKPGRFLRPLRNITYLNEQCHEIGMADSWVPADGSEPVATLANLPDYAHSLDTVARLEAIVRELRGSAGV